MIDLALQNRFLGLLGCRLFNLQLQSFLLFLFLLPVGRLSLSLTAFGAADLVAYLAYPFKASAVEFSLLQGFD